MTEQVVWIAMVIDIVTPLKQQARQMMMLGLSRMEPISGLGVQQMPHQRTHAVSYAISSGPILMVMATVTIVRLVLS